MLGNIPQSLEQLNWEAWIAPLVGLSCAGLMLIMARMVLRWGQQAPPKLPTKGSGESALHRNPSEPGSNGERRTAVRWGGKSVKVLISDAEGKAEPSMGWVRDRSLGGLCVEVRQPVEINTILSIRAADVSVETPWIQVEVRRCREREGRWELGCQFVRTPPYSQLLLFG